jgi:Putative phage tail protein
MATLVLGAIGGLLGGGIGRAAGAIIGQQIDGRLFGPRSSSGPRLSDLTFQSSSYGAPIPRIYGRARVAGSVIWATDIAEDRRKVSSGKGRPKQTVYSYSASFAVALSARKTGRIGRIWADGKLLRGEAGDFKTQTGFRFHHGEEDQSSDPLIAASEGTGSAPAYRGIAYGVFEDFQLEPYGNRIPSISFEVIADEGPVTLGTILDDILPTGFSGTSSTTLPGLALAGESIAASLDQLGEVISLTLREDGETLVVADGGALTDIILRRDDLGAARGDQGNARLERERAEVDTVPARLALSYFDISRDYLEGQQTVARSGGGLRETRLNFAASLSAGDAKALLSRQLAQMLAARERISVSMPWAAMGIAPGAEVAIDGVPGRWRVEQVLLEAMVVKVQLVRLASAAALAYAADAGRPVLEADVLPGFTFLHLLDLPWLGNGVATAPSVYVAAAGTLAGWRSAALLQSTDGGASVEEVGVTALPATIGVAVSVLPSGFENGFDDRSTVTIEFPHAAMVLVNSDDAGLLAGRNLALVGDELIQFGVAEPQGSNQYRLSHLLRGRRGTEWAMAGHLGGERFTLIEADALAPVAVPYATPLTIYGSGIGDITAISASLNVGARALEPPSPVHLSYDATGSSGINLHWVRRSRDGWRWADFVDAPLAEQAELYRVNVLSNGTVLRTAETNTANWLYENAAIAADIAAGANAVSIEVRQIGTYAASRPEILTLNLTQL